MKRPEDSNWYKWFAWYPVWDESKMYFMTYVWRKDTYSRFTGKWTSRYWPYDEDE